ncbi:hypothetical protein LY76DRAFT_117340 [Colletotrichum caudatum]|nr:hypothetical protein LY76DRAFT_117340 [Colletotrichum caudatum]
MAAACHPVPATSSTPDQGPASESRASYLSMPCTVCMDTVCSFALAGGGFSFIFYILIPPCPLVDSVPEPELGLPVGVVRIEPQLHTLRPRLPAYSAVPTQVGWFSLGPRHT